MCLYTVPPGAIRTEIIKTSSSEKIGEGYSILCRILKNVSGLTETPTAQWFNNKGLVTEGNGVLSTGEQSVLTFSTLKTSHAGSYRCKGSVTSPALEQPLVTNSTWKLIVKSKSHMLPMYTTHTSLRSTVAVPDPSVTLMRNKVNSKLYAKDSVTFTCQVQIRESVDTSVNVSLTWVREFHGQQPEYLITEYIFVDSFHKPTPFIVTSDITVDDLTSLDQTVSCRSVVQPLEEKYISSSRESSQTITLDVTSKCHHGITKFMLIDSLLLVIYVSMFTGIFLRLNNSIFPNSSSVLVSDLQPIQCHSDNSEANGQPEWRFPNGTRVREDGVIVATKQETHVTLSRADSTASVPLGQYCCMTQDARRRSHTLCVNIIGGECEAACM